MALCLSSGIDHEISGSVPVCLIDQIEESCERDTKMYDLDNGLRFYRLFVRALFEQAFTDLEPFYGQETFAVADHSQSL